MDALHPQVVALQELMAAAGARPISEGTLDDARRRPAGIIHLTGPGPEMAAERDLVVAGDGVELPSRLYRPGSGRQAALLVYFHGGGWAVGEIDHFDGVCRRLASACDCDVLSVGYRLAPEHPFPTAADDAFLAVRWASDELADGRPVVVAGDSSGGNIAAVAARRARDAGEPAIGLQVLIYPVTDHDFERPSYVEHRKSTFALSAGDMAYLWDLYLPDVGRRSHEDASPLRAADLAGLPPALVIVAGHDPLRDEGLAYAKRLAEAGVPVTVRRYDDVTHGFFTLAGYLDRGDEAMAEIADAIDAVSAA